MSYQPLSKLISQVPTTKELHITTDNWPEERKKLAEIKRDPQNPDFNNKLLILGKYPMNFSDFISLTV